MSHRHWCDYSGHYWDCSGTAVRLFQNEATVCMCIKHGVSMDNGDHNACPIELLSCPEHRADQLRAMGYEPDHVFEQQDQDTRTKRDAQGNPIVGFCAWCERDFYSLEDHFEHWGDPIKCPVYNEYIEKHPSPRDSEESAGDADLLEHEEEG